MPKIIARVKDAITSPPKRYSEIKANSVVMPVRKVRDRVWFIDRSSNCSIGIFL